MRAEVLDREEGANNASAQGRGQSVCCGLRGGGTGLALEERRRSHLG